jgi:hypothetical protein
MQGSFQRISTGTWLAGGGGLLLLIGYFMPWISTPLISPSGSDITSLPLVGVPWLIIRHYPK